MSDTTNEEFVRQAYAIAEVKDIAVYVSGDVVIVELALQGTHDGPLRLPQGILPPTGNRMDAPCCDVFRLENGRIQRFDCYPSGTVILGQLGVLGYLDAVLQTTVG
jgi:ketosteroid isomerase-like protein